MELFDLAGGAYAAVSSWLSNQHNIPPFYSVNELLLMLFVLGVAFNQAQGYVLTPLVLVIICVCETRIWRWQLYALYCSSAAISITNYNTSKDHIYGSRFNVIARFTFLIIAFLTLTIAIIFPMMPPITATKNNSGCCEVGVQDVVLGDSSSIDNMSTHFYVRFYYPTAGRVSKKSNRLVIIAFSIWLATVYLTLFESTLSSFSVDSKISALILATNAIRYWIIKMCNVQYMDYMPGGLAVLNGMAKYAELPLFLFMHMVLMTTRTYADAPVVMRDDKTEPRLVYFFTGLGGCRSSYSSTCVHLASLGYIVVVAEFTDGTAACTVMPSGLTRYYTAYRVTSTDNILNPDLGCFNQWRYRNNQLKKRSTEMEILNKFIFDADNSCLQSIIYTNTSEKNNFFTTFSALRSRIQTVFLCGHSFGGATAVFLNGSSKEPAVAFRKSLKNAKIAGVCLSDPWLYPLDETENEFSDNKTSTRDNHDISTIPPLPPRFTVPLLVMHADLFQWPYNLNKENNLISTFEKALQVRVRDAGHYNFNEIGLLSPFITAKMKKNGSQEPLALLNNINKAIGYFFDNISENDSTLNSSVNGEKKAHLLSKSLNSIQKIKTFEVLKANW